MLRQCRRQLRTVREENLGIQGMSIPMFGASKVVEVGFGENGWFRHRIFSVLLWKAAPIAS